MEDKKEYLRDIAKEHWECGQPFSSDDFRLFQRLCREDGFDVDGKDWSYYWECYEDCRYNDNVQNYDMEDLTEATGEKIFESFDDEEYWNPNEITTKVEFSKPEIEKEGTYTFTIVNALISNLSSGKSRDFTIQYTKSEYGLTVEVYDNESQLDKTHIYMETTSLENDFDTEERTDWLYDNLPDLTKKLLHSKMLSKDLSEKLAYTILDNATNLAVGYSIGIENLQEAAGEKNARRRVWGSSWIEEYTGVSNLDFFGEYLLDEIKSNLESLTCNVGGRQRMAIDMDRTEISIDKDPAPNESVKERRIRGWVYFNSNFNVIMEDRQVLKQKAIQAFKAGMVDFNDKYKMDYLVCKDMVLLSKSFKYGNDNKSMYFVFKAEEEKFHNERPQSIIVHKHSRESHEQGTCPICGEKMWSDDEIVDVLLDGKERSVHGYHCTDESLEKLHDYCDKFWATHDSSGYNYYSAIRQFHPPLCTLIKSTRESKEMFESILNESYHSWEDFYKKGCKLGLNSYMTKLDILHDKYGGFKNVPRDKIQPILDEIPDNDYDVYNFVEEMIDYFGF